MSRRWIACVVGMCLTSLETFCGARSELSTASAEPGDARSDVIPQACKADRPFGAAVALSSLNTSSNEFDIVLTSDELTAIVTRAEPGPSLPSLLIFSRASTSSAFEGGSSIAGIGTMPAGYASITDDQLHLICLCGQQDQAPPLCNFERAHLSDPFVVAPLKIIAPSHSMQIAAGPYGLNNGLTLYYDSFFSGIMRASRDNIADDFSAVTSVVINFGVDGGVPALPIASQDELSIFFDRDVNALAPRIWQATRMNRDQPFTNPHPVSELATTRGEGATWISADGCRLYFSRLIDSDGAGPQWDLFVASRLN